ncbi:MAG: transposase, partial [Flammeovirgaceae bacterium]|nr:transposase [Flammeovirgaceae bacterium]
NIKSSCTTSEKGRSIRRQSNQEWKDQYLLKMKSVEGKEKMRLRRMLSEHPFGTIKYWMGQIPLLTRGLRGVQTEVTIYTIVYNFRRWLSLESFNIMKERIIDFNWKPI